MASYDEIFGKSKGGGGGGGGSGAAATRRREEAKERQAEQEQQVHDRELARQEPVKETVADDKDVVLSNPRWSVERAFFTQKVKASVDVAIPKSRGDVSKVTFTLFAILPNGKRSQQIGMAEGHPDAKGTVTVDIVLHYPESNERVIVKPVESYQYFFIAKHKYSKEIAGPEIKVVDHSVSIVQFIPENIYFDISGGLGEIRGSIAERRYLEANKDGVETLRGGVDIALEFRNRSQKNRDNFKEYKWKQFIHTNLPNDDQGNAYEDVLKSERQKNTDGHEFWYGDGQDREYQILMYNINDGGYFTDSPRRPFDSGHSINWHARLVLFGVESSGSSKELASLEYGFVLDKNSNVHVELPKFNRKR